MYNSAAVYAWLTVGTQVFHRRLSNRERYATVQLLEEKMRRTTKTLVGTMAVMLALLPATSARADSLVLFYTFFRDVGQIETGSVAPDGTFANLQFFGAPLWTHIAGLGNGLVLSYDANTGSAKTAFVDTDGTFTILLSYFPFAHWTHIAGLGNGLVLFYDADTGSAETGSVDTDGIFTNLQVFSISAFPPWTLVVGL